MAGSEPHWLSRPTAHKGAPNIIFVLADDVGFADIGCFGAEINTPHLDRLAAEGVRFSNFHVNPMCSPTRASLLTGVNCHAAGMGHIAQDDPGFPGYRAELGNDVATAAEILRGHGYATMMVGKWHLCRDSAMSAGGPYDAWPVQRGFDRFYGILEAFTNLHQPHRLIEDNCAVITDRYPDGYFLTDDLSDRAITMLRERHASRPGQPFMLYVAHPAAHAPLLAKSADIDRYRDTYTVGWDEIRRRRFERQIELGIITAGTVLPAREASDVDGVRAWDDLSDTERLVYARYMAVYAAMVDEIDQSVGRLRAALEETGQWDNTIVVYMSDNGASREGEATGTTNYFAHLAGAPETVTRDAERLDLIGSAQTMSHYPRGWAMAGNTPFRLYKRHTHAGGIQVPCIISWPAGLAEHAGEIRTQYGHCVDILPTVLDLAGLTAPAEHRGHALRAMDGVSLVPVLRDAAHDEVRTEQYFENEGHRGFYRDGWEVVSNRVPRTPFGDHELSCATSAPTRPKPAIWPPSNPPGSPRCRMGGMRQLSATTCIPSTRARVGAGWCARPTTTCSTNPSRSGRARRRWRGSAAVRSPGSGRSRSPSTSPTRRGPTACSSPTAIKVAATRSRCATTDSCSCTTTATAPPPRTTPGRCPPGDTRFSSVSPRRAADGGTSA